MTHRLFKDNGLRHDRRPRLAVRAACRLSAGPGPILRERDHHRQHDQQHHREHHQQREEQHEHEHHRQQHQHYIPCLKQTDNLMLLNAANGAGLTRASSISL